MNSTRRHPEKQLKCPARAFNHDLQCQFVASRQQFQKMCALRTETETIHSPVM
jgi:hypothetical protein